MPQHIEKDAITHAILTRMWELNNKLAQGYTLSDKEREFFNQYLSFIQTYYSTYAEYWGLQQQY